jgi:hypothetical protein
MQIFIPTRGRVPLQFTWKNLPENLKACATLVCPEEEVDFHALRGRHATARPDKPLSHVRQWIVSELARQDEPVIMLDDDLAFFVRADPNAWNLKPADGAETTRIFERLHEHVASGMFAHAGLSPRQFNNTSFPHTEVRTTRMNAVHCVDPEVLRREDIRYDAVDLMEDYHVTLSLFKKGYDNVVVVDAAWDQARGSGADGGFALTRTKERQHDAAHKLASLHPDCVKVVTKKPKTGQGDVWGGERTDVKVLWGEALRRGKYRPLFRRS